MIQKINLDFQILDTNDLKFISILDTSVWAHIENKPSIIEIILPGSNSPITNYFLKNQVNNFNSINLNLNCISECGDVEFSNLPDGVYIITLKGSPDSFNITKKYLRTNSLQLEIDKIFINLNLTCREQDKNILDKISFIELLLKGAEANLRNDNIEMSRELFLKATDLVKKLKNCKSCVVV